MNDPLFENRMCFNSNDFGNHFNTARENRIIYHQLTQYNSQEQIIIMK